MSHRTLIAYQKAFALAMSIYEVSKSFPPEEKYSLTDQVRRSTRSVCAAIAEAYRKRRYEAHFVSKLTDSDMENGESQVWFEFAFACKYINQKQFDDLCAASDEVGRLLAHMIENPKKFLPRTDKQ